MQHQLEIILSTYPEYAMMISIFVNIAISIIGFIPSVFLTAINIKLFGLTGGFLVSIIGESFGALVTFWLYRIGFQRIVENRISVYPKVHRLLHAQGKEAFWLILSFRFLPFVPSSLVTLFASLGKVSWIVFALASTIGKIPALLLEVYSVHVVLSGPILAKVILCLIAMGILFYVWKKRST